jgi:TRAP-type mannitol/chloroaromatic compound transport system permease small subunit
MRVALNAVDGLNARLAALACWCAPLMVITLTYEVAVRYLLGAATFWSYDVSYFLNSFMVMIGAGYTLMRKGHITVDVISSRFPPRVRAGLDLLLAAVLLLPMCGVLLWTMWPNMIQSWTMGERAATGTWLPPIYPFKAWVFAGFALLMLQALAQMLRDALTLMNREP